MIFDNSNLIVGKIKKAKIKHRHPVHRKSSFSQTEFIIGKSDFALDDIHLDVHLDDI